MSGLRVVQVTEDLAPACGALERLCFPHADPSELIDVEDVVESSRIFPEGFFVILDGDRVVGQGGGHLLEFRLRAPAAQHFEHHGDPPVRNHSPDGDWYYGTDIAVHPEYRRRGIGSMLYSLRKELVRKRQKRGILGGGHMPGFADHKHRMSAADYIDCVVRGEIYDPTLSFQLHNGFRVVCPLANYLKDEATGLVVGVDPVGQSGPGGGVTRGHVRGRVRP